MKETISSHYGVDERLMHCNCNNDGLLTSRQMDERESLMNAKSTSNRIGNERE